MLFTKREDRPMKNTEQFREVRQSEEKNCLLICTLTAILCFTGCASTKAELDYDKATVEQSVEFLVSYCSSADDAAMEQWGELSDYEIQYQLMQAGLPYTPDSFLGAMESWTAGVEECGAYVGHGDYVYEASEDELKVTTEAQFKIETHLLHLSLMTT